MKFKFYFLLLSGFSFFLYFTNLGYSIQTFTLQEVILAGIKNNPEIKISEKIKEEYFYQKNLIRAEFFPKLYVNYNYQRYDMGKNKPILNLHSLGPTLNWNIFSGFSTWHAYREALLLVLAQDENIKTKTLEVVLEIVRAYLDYFKQKALYEAALADLEDAKTLLRLAQKKYEVGLSPYADVLDAEARVKEAEFKVINYKYTSEIAKAKVLTLINYDLLKIEEVEFLPIEETHLKPKTLEESLKLGLVKRPELKSKEKEVLAQKEKVNSVKGEFYPTVDLFATYYKEDSKFFPEQDYEFLAGVKISFPLFTGFSTWAKLSQAKRALERKTWEKNNVELLIKQEIFTVYKNWQTADESYKSAQALLKSMEENYRIIQKKYEIGLASIVDVTTVLARLSAARAQMVTSKYDLIFTYYSLIKATGLIPGLEE
ncbi:MAG: TolC family protein [Thermodesulfobacteriaceae bacterium]|nr:TolC family protein [Thermodesulfobacteriaceae bacterium]MDW8135317.1 TolC family protein [Thermodesulfobacterium sp.]